MSAKEKDTEEAQSEAAADESVESNGEATNAEENSEESTDKKAQDEAAESEGTEGTADGKGKSAEDLQKDNDALKDQLLRLAADFDNYRKRMIKEKADAIEYANENLLCDILDPLDNLDRTLDAASSADDEAAKTIAEGVKMTRDGLLKVLTEKYGLSYFGKAGEAFDANEHQALCSVQAAEGEDIEKAMIKEVYQKGYKLHGKVIRHAKVMAVTPKSSG